MLSVTAVDAVIVMKVGVQEMYISILQFEIPGTQPNCSAEGPSTTFPTQDSVFCLGWRKDLSQINLWSGD